MEVGTPTQMWGDMTPHACRKWVILREEEKRAF
jgi:hypothetical protein